VLQDAGARDFAAALRRLAPLRLDRLDRGGGAVLQQLAAQPALYEVAAGYIQRSPQRSAME
jgi:hypothetical protein